jgi:hypothetical protein
MSRCVIRLGPQEQLEQLAVEWRRRVRRARAWCKGRRERRCRRWRVVALLVFAALVTLAALATRSAGG